MGEVRVPCGEPMARERVVNVRQAEQAIRSLLRAIGENPDREGLRDTPARVAAYYDEFLGWGEDPGDALTTVFHEAYDDVILVRDIPFTSLCEHHLLPFVGVAHVAYIPRDGRVTGLSKLARVVDRVAHRLQLQERMTRAIADVIDERLSAEGVVVMVEAEHLCMSIRGVNKPGSRTVTESAAGVFAEDRVRRQQVMAMMLGHRG